MWSQLQVFNYPDDADYSLSNPDHEVLMSVDGGTAQVIDINAWIRRFGIRRKLCLIVMRWRLA